MKLAAEEEAMRAGESGPLAQWAIEHQIKVGQYLGAGDFVTVTQAHASPWASLISGMSTVSAMV